MANSIEFITVLEENFPFSNKPPPQPIDLTIFKDLSICLDDYNCAYVDPLHTLWYFS